MPSSAAPRRWRCVYLFDRIADYHVGALRVVSSISRRASLMPASCRPLLDDTRPNMRAGRQPVAVECRHVRICGRKHYVHVLDRLASEADRRDIHPSSAAWTRQALAVVFVGAEHDGALDAGARLHRGQPAPPGCDPSSRWSLHPFWPAIWCRRRWRSWWGSPRSG